MDQYRLQQEKGSGTFSVVFTAVSLKTGERVAIKCMKNNFDTVDSVIKQKQIQVLNALSKHDNIVKLIEALYDQPRGKLALVFQLMDMNLYECLKSKKTGLSYRKIKFYMFQVFRAIEYMHRQGFFHRDVKPENILVRENIVKLADLGSCKGIHFSPPHTDYISTRWYRPPQCLLTDGYYDEKMDIWGLGCVLFELITRKPLFPGSNELDQINRIHNILGTPDRQILQRFRSQATHMQIKFTPKKGIGFQRFLPKDCPSDFRYFLHELLTYDPKQRISAAQALKHDFFSQFVSHMENSSSLTKNQELKSTFFMMNQSFVNHKKLKSDDGDEVDSVKTKKRISIHKNFESKHNLERKEQEMKLPKINPTKTNFSSSLEAYKKSFYNRKISNEIGFVGIQGKKIG